MTPAELLIDTEQRPRRGRRAAYYIPGYRVALVREGSLPCDSAPVLNTPGDAARFFAQYYRAAQLDREAFTAALLNVRHRVIGFTLVSVGCLTSSLVHPREVFKPALLASAAALVVAHNHPSGDPEPSAEDLALTRRLASAGTLLGVELLDHLVIGEGSRYTSLKERGAL